MNTAEDGWPTQHPGTAPCRACDQLITYARIDGFAHAVPVDFETYALHVTTCPRHREDRSPGKGNAPWSGVVSLGSAW